MKKQHAYAYTSADYLASTMKKLYPKIDLVQLEMCKRMFELDINRFKRGKNLMKFSDIGPILYEATKFSDIV